MKIVFDVEMTDGQTHRVSTVYADLLALEDKFNIDASELAERQRAGWMAFLAWNALTRDKKISTPFEDFTTTLAGLTPVSDDESKDDGSGKEEAPPSSGSPQ